MKNTIRSLSALAFLSATLLAAPLFEQPTGSTTTTTTTSSGTITGYSPSGLVVRTTESTDPITYVSTKTTTYVDENGNPVSIETVKSGLPVTVYYDRDGNKMVATKVVVRKTGVVAPTTTIVQETVAPSAGTITMVGPSSIAIQTTTSTDPITYSSTKKTTYVDEKGNPVSIETVKSGLPATVYYDQDGSKMIATKVVVKKTTTTTN